MSINTKNYWENRFALGDWEAKMGRQQTTLFAKTLVRYLRIPAEFSGKILDFGCALGEAMPIYREQYKCASLIGVDISQAAIAKCKERYGNIAQFINCDYTQVPDADVIVSSNVFEHLSNQIEVARQLLTKCTDFYIIVPYKEVLRPGTEHVNSYDENSFNELGECNCIVFLSEGWSQYGRRLWFDIYLKNLLRPLLGRNTVCRNKQIMFHLLGKKHAHNNMS